MRLATTLLASVAMAAAVPALAQAPPKTTWYWQLQGGVNTSHDSTVAKIYDIDLFDNSATMIALLKSQGHLVVCYYSAGTWENWRPDASKFPDAVLGGKVDKWAGERYLDVRDPTVRALMVERLAMAKSKNCDGVEPDNVDTYTARRSGFPLRATDQIAYNTWTADQAHSQGLLVALKNDTAQVKQLVSHYDFAIEEECLRYNECSQYSPFVQAGKAVLGAEYNTYSADKCAKASALSLSVAFYNLALNGKTYQPCWPHP